MSDLYLEQNQNVPNTVKTRYRDMGDGTHAEVLATVAIASPVSALDFVHVEKIITTASQVVVPANANRQYLLLINDSDTVIYLNLNGAAAANSGIRLNANGGSYEMGLNALTVGAVTAIHGGAGDKRLIVTEGV